MKFFFEKPTFFTLIAIRTSEFIKFIVYFVTFENTLNNAHVLDWREIESQLSHVDGSILFDDGTFQAIKNISTTKKMHKFVAKVE